MLMAIVKLLMMMMMTGSLFASRFPKCGGVAVRIGPRFMAAMMLLRACSYHPVIIFFGHTVASSERPFLFSASTVG